MDKLQFRLSRQERHQQLLDAALAVAMDTGGCVDHSRVAKLAAVSLGTVRGHFPDRRCLYNAMYTEAARTKNLGILAHGLAHNIQVLQGIPCELKRRAAEYPGPHRVYLERKLRNYDRAGRCGK